MRRSHMIALISLGVLVFLVASALLARALSIGGAEDSAITDLIRAEARGSAAGVVSLISGCHGDASCRLRAAQVSSALRTPGKVSIIQIQPSTGFSVGPTLGTARVAWFAGSSLPRVQCVRVRHAGNVIQGFKVDLLEISVRIKSDHACPARF